MADIAPAAGLPAAPPIVGYRQLTADELALINEGKMLGEQIAAFIRRLDMLPACSGRIGQIAPMHVNKRWLSIGMTDMQKGLMSLLRAIARPTTF